MEFPLDEFRDIYDVGVTQVGDAALLALASEARCLVGRRCGSSCGNISWMLLVRHLLAMHEQSKAGNAPAGRVASATVDRVSVSYAGFDAADKSARSSWLSLTPWGQRLMVHEESCVAGGSYVGGADERAPYPIVSGGPLW